MKRTRSTVLATTSVLALSLAACGGAGDDGASADKGSFTPKGGVTMLVPFGAGGGSDLAGRATASMIESADKDVTVTEVDRRRVAFEIRVEDDTEVIGTGTHERFVIDLPAFEQRLATKAERVR